MTKDEVTSTEELTAKKRPFWRRPALIVSLFFWLFILGSFIKPILFFAIVTIPVFGVFLFLSIFAFRTRLNAVGIFFWSAPLAFLIIMVLAQLVALVVPTSVTYYLGMDVMTPSGLRMCRSMVSVDNDYLTENWVPTFTMQGHQIQGEAVYCDLGEGNNLIATLVFKGGKKTLRRLPSLAYERHAGEDRQAYPPENMRLKLTGEIAPVLVSLADTRDPKSIKLVQPDKLAETFGAGYSLESLWVEKTNDKYQSFGIDQKLPWVSSDDKSGAAAASDFFLKLGLLVRYPFKRSM
ncbi:MAG: hypothetical protein CL942_06755 [Desulfovibrio sp.]|nr:hypothetical protein [Desulfovibrio sp.]|tara:strand:- start:1022 stop:1900 length:879 start_codon:yes stop_codon:yes gene_type:complete